MNLPPLPLIDNTLFVDNSGWLEGLMTCPRALQYKQLNRRIPVEESSALNFGSALHLALEFRYRHYASQPVDAFYLNDVSPILNEHFAAHPPPVEDFRTLNWAYELLDRYNNRYGQEEFNLLRYTTPQPCPQCNGSGQKEDEMCPWCKGTGYTEVMVELPFALHLCTINDINIVYTGKVDLPILYGDELFVMDHKSTSMLGKSFFERMKMSSQQKGYSWAFEQITGRKVAGFVINAIRTKEPPQYVLQPTDNGGKKKTKLSPEQWWQESFQRERYRLRADTLSEWKHNTISIIEEFLWNYNRGELPMKTMWCNQFGRCPYYDVCDMEEVDRAVYLSSGLFTNNDWSPLKTPTQSKQ